MIDLSKYKQNFEEAQNLVAELKQPRFTSSKMATLIDNFSILENNDLFFSKVKDQVQEINYNLVDCIWAKLIEQLLQMRVRPEIIKIYQSILSEKIEQNFFKQVVLERKEIIVGQFSEAELDEFLKAIEECEDNVIELSVLELLLLNAICHQDDVSVLFFLSEPYNCFPVSREILTAYSQNTEGLDYQKYFKKPHYCAPINHVLDELFESGNAKEDKNLNFRAVLTESEHTAIQIIRENYKDLKSVLIKTREDQFQKIEVTKTKRAKMQTFFHQRFKKGDYKSVRVEVVDGKTSYIEEIKKYKL